MPLAAWLRGYRAAWLRSDALAGATAAAVVLPQAMAYAALAGLPIQYGLYCALVPTAAYALLGSSRPLSVSTTSTISLLTAAAIATAPDDSDPAEVAAVLAIEVGVLLLLAGVLRLGFVSDFISRPVLAGFKLGMGLTIAASQLGKVLGVDIDGDTFFPKVASALEQLGSASLATFLVASATVGALLALRAYAPGLPASLVVLVGGMVLIAVSALEDRVATVPQVDGGLPAPAIPDLGLAGSLLPAAAGIALMAFVESIAAARAFRGDEDPPVQPDRELLALGAANALGGGFQAYPAGGGLSQTAVNDRAGARTAAAGLVTAVLTALVLVALTGVFDYIPEAVLGAIVLVAALGLVARDEARAIRRQLPRDWGFLLVTFAAVLVFGTLQGILAGVVVSLLSLFWQLNHPPETARREGDALVVRIEGPLYFGNAQRTIDRLAELVHAAEPRPRLLVLDFSAVTDADTTTATVLGERIDELEASGVDVRFAALSDRVLGLTERGAHWDESSARVYPTVEAAVAGRGSRP